MTTYTLVLAQLVPQLLVMSGILVAGRFLQDRLLGWSTLVARTLFVGVVVGGLSTYVPWVTRSWVLVTSQRAHGNGDWRSLVTTLDEYRQLGGSLTTAMELRLATGLVNLRQWRQAESTLRALTTEPATGVLRGPRGAVELLPVCWYHLGNRRAAELAFQSLIGSEHGSRLSKIAPLYYLGRLAEEHEEWDRALQYYRQGLEMEPMFYPAVYHEARVLAEKGRSAEAASMLSRFAGAGGGDAASEMATYVEALSKPGGRLPAREFYLVFK